MNWISVQDIMPPNLEKILFFWIYDGVIKNVSMGYTVDGEWSIYLPYASFDLSNEFIEVTHWMPLPDYPSNKCQCAGSNGLGQCNCKEV